MLELPHITTLEAFRRWRAVPELWAAPATRIAQRAGIRAPTPRPFAAGTTLVVDLDGAHVLKLYPPVLASQFTTERTALRQLAGRLSVPIPHICAEGGDTGWSWLIITRLPGTTGSEIWPALPETDRLHILHQVGRCIAEVQATPSGPLSQLPPAWPVFINEQIQHCMARHRRHGLPEPLLDDLSAVVKAAPSVLPADPQRVILTGEWIPENLMLEHTPEGWRLAAIIDFGDVQTGPAEYDLLGASTFMCAGHTERLKSFLDGYGLSPAALDAKMRRCLFTLMLLHRASDLRGIAIPGWQDRVTHLQDLEDLIWPDLT